MGEYVRAAYIAVGLLIPWLVLLRWLHPQPTTQDLSLGFLLGMSGTLLVMVILRLAPWPEEGFPEAFLTAGALEEGVKLSLGGLLLRRLGGEAWLGPAEGALTLAFLGAGFEAVEDFQYLIGGLAQGVPLGEVVVARSLPMHLVLGLVAGGWLVKTTDKPLWFLWTWVLAAGLHGGFNAVAARVPFPWAVAYFAGILGWGLFRFLKKRSYSPWRLAAVFRRMDPWEAGIVMQRLGWETWDHLTQEGRSPAGWVMALGLGILYPLLILALGLLLHAVGGG